ncbi:hypothetical protein GQ55_1G402600 [Panicum hallii var. hallii]|uniref:Uncharacterized protein n=1 Tax=Panicum hallii var. hallii TaxID=1504633 RepID=A0A2T7FCI7_9POAL|nr:hypothetical protein GQ55_1G402600 [Panicum hallii var. hallii]
MIDVIKESSRSLSSLWWPVAYDLILHVGAYSLFNNVKRCFARLLVVQTALFVMCLL